MKTKFELERQKLGKVSKNDQEDELTFCGCGFQRNRNVEAENLEPKGVC